MAAFDWEDAFRLEDQLSEDERMIRDTARRYADERLSPRIVEAFEKETVDPSIFNFETAGLFQGTSAGSKTKGISRSWDARRI